MSNIPSKSYTVKFPQRERASVFITGTGVPFMNALVGITLPSPDYHIERSSSSPVTVFEYVVEGEGKIFLNGKWETAQAGDVYILRSHEGHRYKSDSVHPWKKIWVNYVSDYISPMLDAYHIESGIYRAGSSRVYFEELLSFSDNATQSSDTYYQIADTVHRIVHTVASARDKNDSDEYRIKEALDDAVYEKLNLDDLSEKLHLSKSNLIRVFKKNYGITPYEYLLSLKISAAKILLKDTEMTAKEISDRLCISDEHYFSSLFLKKVGMRPRDYRNKKSTNKSE